MENGMRRKAENVKKDRREIGSGLKSDILKLRAQSSADLVCFIKTANSQGAIYSLGSTFLSLKKKD
jgi:hypothetical protein